MALYWSVGSGFPRSAKSDVLNSEYFGVWSIRDLRTLFRGISPKNATTFSIHLLSGIPLAGKYTSTLSSQIRMSDFCPSTNRSSGLTGQSLLSRDFCWISRKVENFSRNFEKSGFPFSWKVDGGVSRCVIFS